MRTYINGTLYSIFTRDKLKEQAHALGVPTMLEHLMENSDEQFKRQIQYILDQLNSQSTDDGVSDDNEDYYDNDEEEEEDENEEEDEEDVIEDEGEFNELLKAEGVVLGEEWLTAQFLASNEEAAR